MRSKRSREGYLYIDNRHGPAITPEAAVATGKDIIGAGLRGVLESATVTCSHCQRVVVLNPMRTRERGYCSRCDSYVCDAPACQLNCTPLRAIMDEARTKELRLIIPGKG